MSVNQNISLFNFLHCFHFNYRSTRFSFYPFMYFYSIIYFNNCLFFVFLSTHKMKIEKINRTGISKIKIL